MDKTEPHRSTQRVLDILDNIVKNQESSLTLSQLSSALNAPKSSLFPIVHTSIVIISPYVYSTRYSHQSSACESSRRVASPGKQLPAYSAGIGKALLSCMARKELEELYPNGLQALTPHTITDMDVPL